MKLELSRRIFEHSSNIKFYENPSSGSRVVACGRTVRQTLGTTGLREADYWTGKRVRGDRGLISLALPASAWTYWEKNITSGQSPWRDLNRGHRQYEKCPSSYRITVWDNIKMNLMELGYHVLGGPVIGFRDEDNESVDSDCRLHKTTQSPEPKQLLQNIYFSRYCKPRLL